MTSCEIFRRALCGRARPENLPPQRNAVATVSLSHDASFPRRGRPAPVAVLHPERLAQRAAAARSASSFQKASERVVALRQLSKAGEANAAAYGAEVHVFVQS